MANFWGDEFLVNTATADDQLLPSIAALADGRFVVAWTDNSLSGDDPSSNAVRAQIFNADGSKSGGEFLVNTTTTSGQGDPSITSAATTPIGFTIPATTLSKWPVRERSTGS